MIESIKKSGTGWLVNGNKSVPNDPRNTDCQEVLLWLSGITEEYVDALELHEVAPDNNLMPELIPNTPEDEFSVEEIEAQRISSIKAEAKSLILDGMSEEEQRNSLAELIAVLYSAMVDPSILQDPVVVEEANARVEAWKRVGAIRDVSNKKEKGEDVVWPT